MFFSIVMHPPTVLGLKMYFIYLILIVRREGAPADMYGPCPCCCFDFDFRLFTVSHRSTVYIRVL